MNSDCSTSGHNDMNKEVTLERCLKRDGRDLARTETGTFVAVQVQPGRMHHLGLAPSAWFGQKLHKNMTIMYNHSA